uniref:APC membrane recruitment protein 2 n=1 Tax=Salarias fasciatus TaxID=181472 RepID=A0A672IKU0_SALFA
REGKSGRGGRGREADRENQQAGVKAMEATECWIMEVQSECVEPPVVPQCDPQPTGKINKAAFKLFGKRRTGSGMASFFSFRNKNGNSLNGNGSVASVELVRSKTHDGLTGSNNDADGQRGEGHVSLEAGPVRSLSKSLSFFSLLRRGSFRSSENGGAGLVRRGRGLKGFFSSMRWRRKDKTNEGEAEESEAKKEKDGDTADSEKVKDITLTLEPTGDPPSEPSVDRLCSLFDSLTGCGDIIADADEEVPQHPAGSGVVAYMGGGEEMASPEGVDDADMQGLWHMLPSTRDNSPALPRSHQPSSSTPTSTYPPRSIPTSSHLPAAPRSIERKVPQVKALGLSKIPVVGGAASRAAKPPLPHAHGRLPTSPGEKEPLSDEGYWDTPSATPTATPDESGLQRNQKMALSRDSCSGDHLYDLYNDPEEEGEDQQGDEELNSTPSPSTEYRMSPTSQTSPPSSSSSSSFRSMKGSASLPRDSKIPISSSKTPPPHSVSQSALSSVVEAESPPPKTQAPAPARTRIPVSKVPVRRSGSKPSSTARGTSGKK